MQVLRTPDERFAGLAGYDFAPHYVEVENPDGGAPLRVHHLDEGPADGEVVLLLHGEPSWSYLYRHMVPLLADAGLHVVAPDLVGFGRSDKPADRGDYTYQRHVDWMRGVLDALALDRITLVGQDWGGLIGLRLVGEEPDRFARVVAANTFLPDGEAPPTEAFFRWQRYSQTVDPFPVSSIIDGATTTELSDEVKAAYDAPFPDESYKAGPRQFPLLVPTSADDPAIPANRRAWAELERFDKPFLTAFSDQDPVTRGSDRVLQRRIPGASGQPHTTIEGGGHFLQEDRGPELARVVVDFVRAT